MMIDPYAARNLLIGLIPHLLRALLLGMAPSWMRGGARRADPSVAAAVFATVYALSCAAILAYDGALLSAPTLPQDTLLALALCGLLSAFVWLCLFTALTGGLVSKVTPIFALWFLLYALASRFLFGTSFGIWHACGAVLALLGVVLIESRTQSLARQLWCIYAALACVAMAGMQLYKRASLGAAFDEALFGLLRGTVAAALLWAFVFVRGKQRTMGVTTARAWVHLPLGALCVSGAMYLERYLPQGAQAGAFHALSVIGLAFVMLFARVIQKERQPGSAAFGMLLMLLGFAAIRFLG